MYTPLVSTTTRSPHRTSPLTRSERILALAVSAALAVVAVLALLAPTATAVPGDAADPTVTAGQIARGKATVPGQATGEQSDINPSRF